MLSSSGEDNNNNKNFNSKSTLSSSSSSSSFSSYSPSSTLIPLPKSMEEVWKDINLSSLHTPSAFRSVPLQDFLARPFSKDPTTPLPTTIYGSPTPLSPPAAAWPSPPLFNLNTDPDHHHHCLQSFNGPVAGPLRMHFDDVVMGTGCNNSGLNTFQENEKSSGGGGERRHKRMIKNRESAARSRARKQAYTNELELEVERLRKENARLKKQQQQLYEAADQFKKESTLQRTTTAPF